MSSDNQTPGGVARVIVDEDEIDDEANDTGLVV